MDNRLQEILIEFDILGRCDRRKLSEDIRYFLDKWTEHEPKRNKKQVRKDWARVVWTRKKIKFFSLKDIMNKANSYHISDKSIRFVFDNNIFSIDFKFLKLLNENVEIFVEDENEHHLSILFDDEEYYLSKEEENYIYRFVNDYK